MTTRALLATLVLLISWLPAQAAPAKPQAKQSSGANFTGAYNAYLNRLRAKVLNNWNPADGRNRVTLQATVAGDGTVGDIVLKSTPNSQAAEQSANAAFAQAQPLEALPTGSPPARLIFSFESYSDPHGESSSNLQARLEPIAGSKPAPAAQPPATESDTPK